VPESNSNAAKPKDGLDGDKPVLMQSQRPARQLSTLLEIDTMYPMNPIQYRGYDIERSILTGNYYADPHHAQLTNTRLRAGTLAELKTLIDEVCDETTIVDLFTEADRIMSKPLYETAA
jgi:hypothetical protein